MRPGRTKNSLLIYGLQALMLCGILAALSQAFSSQQPAAPHTASPPTTTSDRLQPEWDLTFEDEFSGTSPDKSKWKLSQGTTPAREAPLQEYVPEQVRIENGFLRIHSERKRVQGHEFASGELKTLGNFSQLYGRFAARCRFSNLPGTWSAIYLLSETGTWPPEIDIAEHIGLDPSTIYLTNHWGESPEQHQQENFNTNDTHADWTQWHDYVMEWEPGVVRWYIDGTLRGVAEHDVSNVPMYLCINTAIGGSFAGTPSSSGWPQDFDIAYARVYTRAHLPPQIRIGQAMHIALLHTVRAGAWMLNNNALTWLSIVVLFVVWLAYRRSPRRRALLGQALTAAVSISAIHYFAFRVQIVEWQNGWIALPLLLAEIFGMAHVLGFLYTVWPRPCPVWQVEGPMEDPMCLPLFIFIPTVNEGEVILEATLCGAMAARDHYLQTYPGAQISIVVCNDGRVAQASCWQDVERLAERMGITCITRTLGGGAKAGNIEYARQQVGAIGNALIVVFDADMVAEPDFLLKTVSYFADPAIGWVQTGQYYRNLDNAVARWASDQQAFFYDVICPGKAAVNANFLCGTNFVMRAKALDDIGGLPQDCVTEDFAASILLHPRWRSVYLTDVLATGLGPEDLKSYFTQQRRWATGVFTVLGRHWRAILLPQREGLTLPQRIQYALSCTHYMCGVCNGVYIAAPILFFLFGISAVRPLDIGHFVLYFLPYWLLTALTYWYVAGKKLHLCGHVIGFGSFPVLMGSLWTAFRGARVDFAVTAKQRHATFRLRLVAPQVMSAAGCLVALQQAGTHIEQASSLSKPLLEVSLFWLVFLLLMLSGTLWLGWLDWRHARLTGLRKKEEIEEEQDITAPI